MSPHLLRLFALACAATSVFCADLRSSSLRLPPTLRFERGASPGQFVERSQGILLDAAGVTLARGEERVGLRWAGASAATAEPAADPAGYSHFYIGHSGWHPAVKQYARVRYHNVWQGIDVVFRGSGSDLEYDFVLAPGADPARIAIDFTGIRQLHQGRDGELRIDTAQGSLRQRIPHIYQEVDGTTRTVAGTFRILGPARAGIQLAAYDRSRALVIDPVLESVATLRGDGSTTISAVASDRNGVTYAAGRTTATSLGGYSRPSSGPDAFVARIGASGEILSVTYLGGAGDDAATAIALDHDGNCYLAGWTTSADFPVTGAYRSRIGGGRDAFAAKLSPSGELLYATYLGGAADDEARGIAVDAAGAAYVTGVTGSRDLATNQAAQFQLQGQRDAFVVKLLPAGNSAAYATYLGGSGDDAGQAIAVDASGRVFVAGSTTSADFAGAGSGRAFSGGTDTFVTALAPEGNLEYTSLLGGAGKDEPAGIALDAAGNVFVSGVTDSDDFPVLQPFQAKRAGGTDAFLARFDARGVLQFASYLGGKSDDSASGLAVASDGAVQLTGWTASADFPLRGDSAVGRAGAVDGFAARVADGLLVEATCMGGSGLRWPRAVAISAGTGTAFLAGDASAAGSTFGFVSKVTRTSAATLAAAAVTSGASLAYTLAPNPLDFGPIAVNALASLPVTLTNTGSATLTVSEIAASGLGFSASSRLLSPQNATLPASLAPGESILIGVSFLPNKAASFTGTVTIATDAGPVSAALSGSGVAPSGITLGPASYNFGPVQAGGTPATTTVTLVNASSGSITVDSAAISGAGFALDNSPTLPLTLKPGTSAAFTVVFHPAVTGPATGVLNVGTSRGLRSMSVSGTGIEKTTSTQLGARVTGLSPLVSPPSYMTCSMTGNPTMLRAEGATELAGDIVLTCTGGVPTLSTETVPQANLTVYLNTVITSRQYVEGANNYQVSEVLLLVDEPNYSDNRVGFVPCATPDIGCTFAGRSTVLGTAAAGETYGTGGRPNVFRGVVSGNTVQFTGVPIDAPGASGARIFRFSNIRIRGDAFDTPSVANVGHAVAVITSGGNTALMPPSSGVPVGYVIPGLSTAARGAGSLPQCSTGDKALVNTLSFEEQFQIAFKTRGTATQNIPGNIYNTESGFTITGTNGNVWGLADFGTRLKAEFINIPSGVRLFVPVASAATASGSGNATLGSAQLVTSETGAYSAAPATDTVTLASGNVSVAELSIVNGSATAVWEITSANYLSSETLKFPVYATYGADVGFGDAKVKLGFATAGGFPWFTNDPLLRSLFSTSICVAGTPVLSSPANSASDVSLAPALTWNAASGATSYDVYFGASSTPPFVLNTTSTTYTPGTLAAGTSYYWKIVARYPGGNVGSAAWTFRTLSSCSYVLTSASGAAAQAGGSGQVSVATGSSCSWSATASDPWITVSAATQTGSGSVDYTVAANSGSASRTGSISVNGQSYTITQFGTGCDFAVSPSVSNVSSAATTVSVAVQAAVSSCTWSASGLSATPTSGTGSGTVTLSVPANTASTARVLTATVAGQTITVNQAGQPAVVCTAALTPTATSISAAGGTGSVTVTIPSGCSYSTVLGPSWITVSSGGSGATSGTLAYSVASNSTMALRTGTISVGGVAFQITQAAPECSLSVDTSASGSPFGAAGATGTIDVTVDSPRCTWSITAAPSWAPITGATARTGTGALGFTVAANPDASPRSGFFTIEGQQIRITQAGTTCSYSLRASSGNVPAAGGSGSAAVVAASACSWSASSNAPWLTITASGSAGNGDVQYSAAANTDSTARTGSLTVAGQTYTVTQGGAACSFVLTSASSGIVAASGISVPQSFDFTSATAGCTAAAVSYAGWISASTSSGGGSSGSVSYTVAANPSSSVRTGSIQLGNQVFTVTQAGAACGFTLGSYGAIFGQSGGSGTVTATQSAAGCVPAVASAQPAIVQPGTPTGPVSNAWTLPYTVAPFSSVLDTVRRVVVSFGGQSFTVKQTAW
jgi:hypothetical protein